MLTQEVRSESEWTPKLLTERQKRLVGVLEQHWNLVIASVDEIAEAAAS